MRKRSLRSSSESEQEPSSDVDKEEKETSRPEERSDQKDKTYKDQNIPGTKNVRKDFKKECLYDSKGIPLLVCSLGIPGISSLKYFQFEILERS